MRLRTATLLAALVTLALAPARAAGQIIVHQSGVKAGLNLATLTYGEDDGPGLDAGRRAGLAAGVFAVRYLRPRLGLQAEGLLSFKGAQYPTGTLRLTYLESPWLLRYEFDAPSLAPSVIHVVAGPAVALKLGASFKGGGVSTDVGEDFRTLDLGLVVGAGIDHHGLLVDVRYTWGLANVPVDRPEEAPGVHNHSFTLLIGLRMPR